MTWTLLLVALILSAAALTRSAIGFGDSVLAMAMLPFVIPVKTATPLVSLTAILISVLILWERWRQVDALSVWRLIVSSVAGIPLGLWALRGLPESTVKLLLGVMLIVFSTYRLAHPTLFVLRSDRWAYVAGFFAGILGAAYNTNGPPVVIYASLRRWSPERFVATMQGYFLPTGLFIVVGHGLAGLWTSKVFWLYGWSAPLIIAAVLLGGRVQRRLRPGTFDRLLYVFLWLAGLAMCVLR